MSKQELERCNGELRSLDEQERTLLQKHDQGRVSDKLYDEEQVRIAREREAAEAIFERLLLQFDDIEQTLDLALDLTDDIQAAYGKAGPTYTLTRAGGSRIVRLAPSYTARRSPQPTRSGSPNLG